MAEIKIKKKAPIWPWILGLLIVAALVYFLVAGNDNADDVDDTTVNNTVVTDTVPDPTEDMDEIKFDGSQEVDEYHNYISAGNMDMNHEYSSAALNKLISATRATANNLDVDTEADLSKAQTEADEITNNPASLNHADKIKDAAESISKALKTIQNEKFPDLKSQYDEVDQAVSNIKKGTPTLDQKDAIQAFFNKASNLLTSIQNNDGQER